MENDENINEAKRKKGVEESKNRPGTLVTAAGDDNLKEIFHQFRTSKTPVSNYPPSRVWVFRIFKKLIQIMWPTVCRQLSTMVLLGKLCIWTPSVWWNVWLKFHACRICAYFLVKLWLIREICDISGVVFAVRSYLHFANWTRSFRNFLLCMLILMNAQKRLNTFVTRPLFISTEMAKGLMRCLVL